MPLATQGYKWVVVNCQGGVTKCCEGGVGDNLRRLHLLSGVGGRGCSCMWTLHVITVVINQALIMETPRESEY